jgi:hypothetical protein
MSEENELFQHGVAAERKRCLDIIENMPLGYRTEAEHQVLESFADRIQFEIIMGETK